MNAIPRTIVILAGLSCCLTTASAAEPYHKLFGCPVPDCIGKWCRDDYCAKNEPCTSVPLCLQCDDYCSKKAPCVRVPLCFGCDDYRKKCLPKVCSPPRCEDLRCGPGCGCRMRGDGLFIRNVKTAQVKRAVAPDRTSYKSSQVSAFSIDKPAETPAAFVAKLPNELSKQ